MRGGSIGNRAIVAAAGLVALMGLAPTVAAEVSQRQGVRVSVRGDISPRRLPRHGDAPVAVSVAGRIGSTASTPPPQLRSLSIAINRLGRLSYADIPTCRLGRIDPSTTREALAACRGSLLGEGRFSADVKLPEQSPFPSAGKVLAFNGKLRGKRAIFAHIYGTEPVPTSYVLPFLVRRTGGAFGTTLEASLPQVTGEWGFVRGISIRLDRRGFLRAGCPEPHGFGPVPFPLMRVSFGFDGGLQLSETLNRSCRPGG